MTPNLKKESFSCFCRLFFLAFSHGNFHIMESSGGILNKLKDLGPELCVYFLDNLLENEVK